MSRRSQGVLQHGRELKEAFEKPEFSADKRSELINEGVDLASNLAGLILREIGDCEVYVRGDRNSRDSRCYTAPYGSSGRGLERIEKQAATSYYFPYGHGHIQAIAEGAREKAVRELLDDLPQFFEASGGTIVL